MSKATACALQWTAFPGDFVFSEFAGTDANGKPVRVEVMLKTEDRMTRALWTEAVTKGAVRVLTY
jgi:hypothetical protein